ncbi:IS630 transposase-related protein [Candidatus Protochlamydia amoebophila]|uniref:Transposase Synechocystis PCC 6803 domain-containing protein n=1 Tax=Protochlamydia amoebophila (strain UWE25) TaxID=264201 RepID=A0A2P9H9M9_PARUW|nr:unnamed protein product [Candidatus Protochlamydia amoebophila UWE25]
MFIKEIVAHFGVTVQAIFYACKRQKSFLKKIVFHPSQKQKV